jgi:hypothetical protein
MPQKRGFIMSSTPLKKKSSISMRFALFPLYTELYPCEPKGMISKGCNAC